MEFSLEVRGQVGALGIADMKVLAGFDLGDTNSADAETVQPFAHPDAKVDGLMLRARLPAASWNVFVLNYA
jgi:hypothetical protein